MLTYLQDSDRLSVYVVCNFALSLSLFYLLLYDMLVAYGPLSLINHQLGIIEKKLNIAGDFWVGKSQVIYYRGRIPRHPQELTFAVGHTVVGLQLALTE